MTPRTILVRVPNLEIHLGDAEDVSIVRGDERVVSTPHALTILAAFAHPRPLADVLGVVAEGGQDWIELSSAIYQLVQAGILVEPGASAPVPRGYAQAPIHVAMLDDQARTRGFIDALRALIRPDDVVLDIGTGTGVLATIAALAGAARVNAVESSAIADAAARVFAANGVADRVTLVRGRSTSITLPERCHLLVTEMIGNDPLDEQLLDIVDDAKKRLLTPDARLIPSAIEVFAVPVEPSRRFHERRVFGAERTSAWRELYGVDFSTLLTERQLAAQRFSVRTSEVLTWERAAPAVSLVAIDLTRPFDLSIHRQVSFTLARDVERLGVLLAFRATLAPGLVLSTLPDEVAPDNHWRYGVWPSTDRGSLTRGTSCSIDYTYSRGATTLVVG